MAGGCWWLESCRRLAAVLAGKLRTLLLSCLEPGAGAATSGAKHSGLAAAGEILADISRGSGCSNREQRRQSHRRRWGGLFYLILSFFPTSACFGPFSSVFCLFSSILHFWHSKIFSASGVTRHNKFQIMLFFHSCQDTILMPLG